jgi:hypothetical protein
MKRNIKYIFAALLLMFIINNNFAQLDSKKDKIAALRASFISKKVNFTAQETQYFWPLYNEMNDKVDAARKAFRTQYNANTNYNFTTDKEAEAYLNAELYLKQKEFEIYKEYYDKFKKVIPVLKVAAVRRAEDDFKKEIIKTIKEN